MPTSGQKRLIKIAEAAAARSGDPTRHRCFVSYHHEDQEEAEQFVDAFGHVFIAKCLGVSDEDDFIDSDDADYIMREIRERYLTTTTVTLLMLGECTWARRYVDWETASSLRDDPVNKRSGLIAIRLSSLSSVALPDRFKDNWKKDGSKDYYARYYSYPSSDEGLRANIEDAFSARTGRGHLVDNSRDLFGYNRTCS